MRRVGIYSLNVWLRSSMKTAGPGLLFVGRFVYLFIYLFIYLFFITDLISLLIISLFEFCISSCFDFGIDSYQTYSIYMFLRIYFFVLPLVWFLMVNGTNSQIKCLSAAHCSSCSGTRVFGYLPLSPGQRSLRSGAGRYQGFLQKEKCQEPLWRDPC